MTPMPVRRCAAAAAALLALLACSGEPRPSVAPDLVTRPLFPKVGEATIGSETRAAMVLQPPELAFRRVEIEVPPAAQLHFGFGVPNASIAQAAAPAYFELALLGGSATREVLAQATIDGKLPRQRRWFDARADLSAWAGQRVSLEFRVAVAPGEGPKPLAAISKPVLTSARYEPEHPNLLIVSLDTLRARNVSAYGYARETTPFLDAFAARGALFEDAITTSVTTGPSHMSLFTGRYPVNHGIRRGTEMKAARAMTLAEILADAGYHTAAFTENGYLMRSHGFGDGFEEYTENHAENRKAPGDVRVTFPQAQRWLTGRARAPFFLFVHTYQVHSPYLPPPEYQEHFAEQPSPHALDPMMGPLQDAYDQEIRFVDDELRKLIATLEATGALANTLVLVLSDHGEEFREHGYFQHGGAVFEESIGIPMILVGPGVPAGRRIDGTVSLIDVLPSTLELLGLDAPAGVDGTSLVAAIRGEAPVDARTLFAEAFAPARWQAPFVGQRWNPPLVAVRAPEGKFIVHRPAEGEALPPQRYDLARDALERDPQPVEGEQRARVDALVDAYLKGSLAPHEVPAEQEIGPEVEERLRALGYL